jgi:predicted transcriptional regulator
MREAQMNREAMTVIAELMWALRRSGAHTFFPGMQLHKAQKLVLVGATVGLAHLTGRPVTLASLSRQLEMPHATTERRLQQLIQAGWVYRRPGTKQSRQGERMYKHILIATDGSDLSRQAIEHGITLAKSVGARVTVLTVSKPFYASAFDPKMVEQYKNHVATLATKHLDVAKYAAEAAGVVCDRSRRA